MINSLIKKSQRKDWKSLREVGQIYAQKNGNKLAPEEAGTIAWRQRSDGSCLRVRFVSPWRGSFSWEEFSS